MRLWVAMRWTFYDYSLTNDFGSSRSRCALFERLLTVDVGGCHDEAVKPYSTNHFRSIRVWIRNFSDDVVKSTEAFLNFHDLPPAEILCILWIKALKCLHGNFMLNKCIAIMRRTGGFTGKAPLYEILTREVFGASCWMRWRKLFCRISR